MSSSWPESAIFSRSQAARAAPAGDDFVLLHLERGTYARLNLSGAFIWKRLDGETPLGEICEAMLGTFRVDRSEAWTDLTALIDDLLAEGLIERADEAAPAQSSNAGR